MIFLGRALIAILLLAAILVTGIAWRLAEGPIELPWLARRIEAAAAAPDRSVTVAHALISWRGFDQAGAPLSLHLIGIDATGGFGVARLGRADVALALAPLLVGKIQPESLDLSDIRLNLVAAALPATGHDSGSPGFAATLQEFATKPAAAARWSDRLAHVRVRDVAAEMEGLPGRIAGLDITLDRAPAGGLTGLAEAELHAGTQQATLTLAAETAPDGGTSLRARMTPISPASLAGTVPEAAPLAALEAPVTLSGSALLGPRLELIRAEASIGIGAGTIHAGQGTAPLLGADLVVTATPDSLALRLLRLDTAADPTAVPTRFTGQAAATRAASGGYGVSLALDLDQVAVADLPALWPEGLGGPGTRPWMTKNITAGRMTAGHVAADLDVRADLSDVALRRIDGRLDGHDVTVHWLRPVPPLEHAEARLTITDPDVIDIAVATAVQAGGTQGGMRYGDASIHLTGIAGKDQFAEINTGLSGPLPDLLAVLNNPRIKLLSKRPLPMRDPAGTVVAKVHVGRLPLRDDVAMDDLVIDTTAHTTHVHLGGIAAGYDLDDGTLDLAANNDGLSVDGTATLAGFATRMKLGMDFRQGPPSQIEQSVEAHSTIDMAHLAALGIAAPGLGGSLQLDANLTQRRDGRTDIALSADLAQISVAQPTMGLAKARGEPGVARVRIALQGDRLAAIDALHVEAPGVLVEGTAQIEGGQPVGMRLDHLVLGSGTNLTGEVRMPPKGGAIAVHLSGPSLDVSPALKHAGPSRPTSGKDGDDKPGLGGMPWTAELAVDRLILGPGRGLQGVRAKADSDGTILRSAAFSGRIAGRAGAGSAMQATIVPDSGGRRLTLDVPDTGAVLREADVTGALIGGRLHVAARWADRLPGRPLGGVAELRDFRIRDAPAIGRVLQALTVYGLAELAAGPGLGFTRLDAPFSLERGVLELRQARAFSASLGFTAKGTIDVRRRIADLSGTVVPAYFFNSLLGRLPLIGGMFSAEKGGGLFAAAVTIKGPLDDLHTSLNPLSALTPGFLRGLFSDDAPTGAP